MFVDSIVGWASLIVGIAGLMDPNKVPNAKVRIQIQSGKDGTNGLDAAGGHIPAISLGGTSQGWLGSYNPYPGLAKLGSDRYWNYDISTNTPTELKTLDIKMEYTVNPKPGQYVTGSLNDGLCMAYMSWTPESTMYNYQARAGAITGDLFYFCGHAWYYSGKKHGTTDLRCGWLDGDDTNGGSVRGMFLNTDILGNGYINSYAANNPIPSDICYWGVSFTTGANPFNRSVPKDIYGNKAYVTAGEGAIALCDSPTSRGPSMLSLKEGVFCDMFTKTKVPICGRGEKEGCVNYNRRLSRAGRAQRTMAANSVSRDSISHDSYELEYFVIADINGTVIDDGSSV